MSCEETYGEDWIPCGDEVCGRWLSCSSYPQHEANMAGLESVAVIVTAQHWARYVLAEDRTEGFAANKGSHAARPTADTAMQAPVVPRYLATVA